MKADVRGLCVVILCSLALTTLALGGCHASKQATWPEATRQASRFGINYPETLTTARHDNSSLRRLFLLSIVVDSAGTDEYAAGLYRLLGEVGEQSFVDTLLSSNEEVQEHVLSILAAYVGFDQDEQGDWIAFERNHPKLAALIKHQRRDQVN